MSFEYRCQSCQAIGDIDSYMDQVECPNCGGIMTPVNTPQSVPDTYAGIVDGEEPTIMVPRSGISDETATAHKRSVKVAKIVDIGFGGMLTTSATGGFKPIAIGGNSPSLPFPQQPAVQQQPQEQTPPPEKEEIPEHVEPAPQKQASTPSQTGVGIQKKKTFTLSKSKPTAAPFPQHGPTPHMDATKIDPRIATAAPHPQQPVPTAAPVQPQRDNSQASLQKPRVAGPTSTSLKFLPKGALKVAQTHTSIKSAQITPPPQPPPQTQAQSQNHTQTQRQIPAQYSQHPSPFPDHDEDFAAQVRIESERQEAILREAYHIAGEKIRKEKEEREAIQARKHAEEVELAAREAAEKRVAKEVAEKLAAKEAAEKRAAREASEKLAAQIAKERAETEELLRKEREALELRKKELLEMKKRAEAEEAERAHREAAEKRAAQFAKERAETEELLRKEREALELSKKELLEMKKRVEEETAKAKHIQDSKTADVKIEKTENVAKSPELPAADTKQDDIKIKEPEKPLLRPTSTVTPKSGEGPAMLTISPENIQSDKKKIETEQPVLKKEELGEKALKAEETKDSNKEDVNAKKNPIKGLPPPSPFNKKGLRPPPFPTKSIPGKSVPEKAGKEDLEKEKASGSDAVKDQTKDKTATKIGINTNLKPEGTAEANKDDANAKKSPIKGLPPPSPFNKKGIKPPPFPAKTAAGKTASEKDSKEDADKEKSSVSDVVKNTAKDKTQTKVGINTTIPITSTTLVKIQNKKKNLILLMVGVAVLVACLLIIFIGGKIFKIAKSSLRSSPVAAPSTTVQNKNPLPVVQSGVKTGSPLEMDYRTIYLKIKKAPPATNRQQIDAIIKEWQDFIDSHPNATAEDKCIKDANTHIKNMQDMRELYNK